jgi:hypothetical protein
MCHSRIREARKIHLDTQSTRELCRLTTLQVSPTEGAKSCSGLSNDALWSHRSEAHSASTFR